MLTGSFLLEFFRRPNYEMAEAVIRLRRLRSMSQAELAVRMGTKQPAVARIESGRSNVRLDTITALAEALRATVRIDLEPEEMVGRVPMPMRWWARADVQRALAAVESPVDTYQAELPVLNEAHTGNNRDYAMLVEKKESQRARTGTALLLTLP